MSAIKKLFSPHSAPRTPASGRSALGCRLWTLDFGLWTVDSGLWTADFGLWAADFGPSANFAQSQL